MPTLQDVARRAGVSTATVSKVLSNTPYVSEATRARVLNAVQEVGYRPNLAARALASGRTHIIAVVLPYIYDIIFRDPPVVSILEGIERVCTENGYNILLSTPHLKEGPIDESYRQLIQSGYIEGLIAIDNTEMISFAAEAEQFNIPAVVLGYHDGDYTIHGDDYAGGQAIMAHVLEHGHEHIGLISVPDEMNIAVAQRVRGIGDAAERAGLQFEALPIVYSDFSTEGGAAAVRQLPEMQPHITAIIGLNDRMAIGAMRQLQQMGKRIPDDISVVGYGNIAMTAVTSPPLTTIDYKSVELGQQAARLMFKRLRGAAPSAVVIPPELVVRESVAAYR